MPASRLTRTDRYRTMSDADLDAERSRLLERLDNNDAGDGDVWSLLTP